MIKKKLYVMRYVSSVKKMLFPCFISLILLFTSASAATVNDVVERIQKAYDNIQDLKGTFSQTSYLKDLERVEKYSGEFFIKRPYSMRWSYSKPRDEEVIIRDSVTWIYKKSEKQVLKTTASKGNYNQVPIALLSSLAELKTDFDIALIKEDNLELLPKNRTGFIKKILLEVDSGDFPIRTLSIFDIHSNRIFISLKNVKVNSGLKDAFFIFKPPPGVEVFDLN